MIKELPDLSAIVENLSNNPRTARSDQYSESEIPWGKWNGSQLYRRCFTVGSDITSSSTIVTWDIGLTPVNLQLTSANTWYLADVSLINSATDRAAVFYRDNTGIVDVVIGGSRTLFAGSSYCMDYTR